MSDKIRCPVCYEYIFQPINKRQDFAECINCKSVINITLYKLRLEIKEGLNYKKEYLWLK